MAELRACPFYGVGLFETTVDQPAVLIGLGTSNGCALITRAHSPCWMQVAEKREPNWLECPRNPEYLASAQTGRISAATFRAVDHAIFLARLLRFGELVPEQSSIEVPAEPLSVRNVLNISRIRRNFEALGHTEPAADTPDTAAEKARAAREIGNAFNDLRRADPRPAPAPILPLDVPGKEPHHREPGDGE